MNGYNEHLMKQEQYRDQARDADRHRVIKLVADDCQESAVGGVFRNLVSGMAGRRPASGQVPCGEPTRLLEKAA